MTAFLLPAEGVLIARAGEEIVCPHCGDVLAVFLRDYLTADFPLTDESEERLLASTYMRSPAGAHPGGFLCLCGGDAVSQILLRNCHYAAAGHSVFIRSGDWLGWRELGE